MAEMSAAETLHLLRSRAMVIVLIRTEVRRDVDAPAYEQLNARMEALVKDIPGFVSAKGYRSDDGDEISIIRFESAEALRRWREQPSTAKPSAAARRSSSRRTTSRSARSRAPTISAARSLGSITEPRTRARLPRATVMRKPGANGWRSAVMQSPEPTSERPAFPAGPAGVSGPMAGSSRVVPPVS